MKTLEEPLSQVLENEYTQQEEQCLRHKCRYVRPYLKGYFSRIGNVGEN